MRHWRKVVPHVDKLGKLTRFSFTDIISLLVVNELVSEFGVHIANIGEGVDALFRGLSEVRPSTLEETVAVVTAVDRRSSPADWWGEVCWTATITAMPLAPQINACVGK